MKQVPIKITRQMLLLTSLIIAVAINFQSSSPDFFIRFPIFTLLIFVLLTILAKIFRSIFSRKFKKFLFHSGLLIIYIGSLCLVFNLLENLYGLDILPFYYYGGHRYRTNIFTRQCDYGGGYTIGGEDPWYYKPDCPKDKKLKAFKEYFESYKPAYPLTQKTYQQYYEERLKECNQYCVNNDGRSFCMLAGGFVNEPNITCDLILDCVHIDCPTVRKPIL